MRILVTGSEGFVGKHLVKLLQKEHHKVECFDIKEGEDFKQYSTVRTSIDAFRPDKIFHIGAQAYVPESFNDPWSTIDTNITGSLNILEAVKNLGLKTKIHLCGSSEEYGDVLEPLEDSAMNPLSPYAISKLAMDQLGRLYAQAYHMNVVVTRTFNHTGPGRGEMYAESAWAKQIAQIERGERTVLLHGDLEPVRNYTDVRDVVKAYALAIDLPSGVYNICSNQNVAMVDVLDMLTGYANCPIVTEADSTLFRPADFSFNKPNCDKFKVLTGWKPEYKLKDTLLDILEYWRNDKT